MTVLGAQLDTLRRLESKSVVGTVASVRGMTLMVSDLPLPVGALVRLERKGAPDASEARIRGEVIGFHGEHGIVMLFGPSHGIAPGMCVRGEQTAQTVQVGRSMLGRIVDGLGRPIDGQHRLLDTVARPLTPLPTGALRRRRIHDPLPTGVRAIDALMTLGKGQRIGVFSGPGVGKSTLLGSIARNTSADVNVIALIGERGREVRDFLEKVLGAGGLAHSVLVVSTGDESPLMRVRAALVACTVAEHFREVGADVLLMMDSITRFAQAQRQIGLAVGEQPATKGYTPSVFAMLPMILERAGAIEDGGSITGVYAVLVEGDDLREPISDAAIGVLDGHIALARRLATAGHHPAVDLGDSISRLADEVCDSNHISARRTILRLMSAYREAEELINIGAYATGSNPDCDVAIAMKPRIDTFLRQTPTEHTEYPETCRGLIELASEVEQRLAKARAAMQSRARQQAAAAG